MGYEENDAIDRLLEEILAKYSSEAPRPGLEQRVLDRIHTEGVRRRFLLPRWVVPIPALACLLAAIAVWSHRSPAPRPPGKVQTAAEKTQPAPAPVVEARPIPNRRRPRPTPAAARRSNLPKQEEFPTRHPLTNEERALIAFVRSVPEQAREAFGETPREELKPIRIEEIQIPPLQIGGNP